MSLAEAFRNSDASIASFRASADLAIAAAGRGAGNPYEAATAARGYLSGAPYSNLAQHTEQYRYFRDVVYTAIRPIATRVAGQPFRVGRKVPGVRTTKGYAVDTPQNRLYLKSAPGFVTKQAKNVEILESHELLDTIEDPNDVHVEWHLKYFTVAGLMLTGKAYWWITERDDGRLQFWPLPANWVRPDNSNGLYSMWHVFPGGPSLATQPIPVSGENICYFFFPDPSDPMGSLSPLQAQARGVSIDEQIQNSQLQSYINGIRPGVILKAGRKPGLPGFPQSGDRITLTPTQRRQIIDAVKMAYAGWMHHNDPAIVDGLIEEIVPWTRSPQEMDYMESSKAIQNRIMLGFGVNPIVTGEREGANRAQSAVADEHFCNNVVNPIQELIGQTATKRIGPRYARPSEKLYVYIEKAKPHDAELELQQYTLGINAKALPKNEVREYLGKAPMEGGDKLPEDAPAVPPPAVQGQRPGENGGPITRRASEDAVDPESLPYRQRIGKDGMVTLWAKQAASAAATLQSQLETFLAGQGAAVAKKLAALSPSEIEALSADDLTAKLLDPADWGAAMADHIGQHLLAIVETGARTQLTLDRTAKNALLRTTPANIHSGIQTFLGDLASSGYWLEIQQDTQKQLRDIFAATYPLDAQVAAEATASVFSPAAVAARAKSLANAIALTAVNCGHWLGMLYQESAGVPLAKVWVSPSDDALPATGRSLYTKLHDVAAGIGDGFIVGGETAPYPGYHRLSPQNRAACSCGIIALYSA